MQGKFANKTPHLTLEGGPLVGVFVYILKKAPKIGLQSAAQKVLGFLFTLFESGLNLKPRAVGG